LKGLGSEKGFEMTIVEFMDFKFHLACMYRSPDGDSYEFFMVTPCINNIQPFIVQLMHTKVKNVKLLKRLKIKEAAPTCFGLQGVWVFG